MSLTTRIDLVISSVHSLAALDFESPRRRLAGGNEHSSAIPYPVAFDAIAYFDNPPYRITRHTPNGVNEGYNDIRWSDRRTLGPSATDTLDLAGGSLLGDFGPVDFDTGRVTLFYVSSVSGALTVTRPTNGLNIFPTVGDSISLPDQGLLLLYTPRISGYTVIPGTQDLVEITAGASGCTYDIHLAGTSEFGELES